MVYHGRVKDGVIVVEGEVRLPEGMTVRIEPVIRQQPSNGETVWDRLLGLAGTVDGLPSDASENVDRYLYDVPEQ